MQMRKVPPRCPQTRARRAGSRMGAPPARRILAWVLLLHGAAAVCGEFKVLSTTFLFSDVGASTAFCRTLDERTEKKNFECRDLELCFFTFYLLILIDGLSS